MNFRSGNDKSKKKVIDTRKFSFHDESVGVTIMFQFYDPDKFVDEIKLQTCRINLYNKTRILKF